MPTSIKQALLKGQKLQSSSDTWKLDAELLLANVIERSREYLFTWPEAELSESQLQAYEKALARRIEGEPIAYITGIQAFWDFELTVNPSVLIPRPETELLVEKALDFIADAADLPLEIADLGTGSGAIALALAKHSSNWNVYAVDVSEQALQVASFNGASLGLENVNYSLSHWCNDFTPQALDLIIANPPYVAEGDQHLDEGSLPFEPLLALVSKDNGLSDIQEIIRDSYRCLKPGGLLLVEHGYNQSVAVVELFENAEFNDIETANDLAGIPRIVFGRKQREIDKVL